MKTIMKKALCLFLVFAMVCVPMIANAATGDTSDVTNLAANKTVTVGDSTTAILTDGTAPTEAYNSLAPQDTYYQVPVTSNDEAADWTSDAPYVGSMIVDLSAEGVTNTISSIKFYTARESRTYNYRISISENGTDWTVLVAESIDTFKNTDQDTTDAYDPASVMVVFKNDINAVANFVRIEVTRKNDGEIVPVSEIEVYGTAVAASDDVVDEITNVALNKSYTAQETNQAGNTLKAKLTDGVASTAAPDTGTDLWFAFTKSALGPEINTVDGVGTLVIDLAGSYSVSEIKVHLYRSWSTSYPTPASVKAYLSTDGETYGDAIEIDVSSLTAGTGTWVSATFDATEAAYVKLEITLADVENCAALLNEVEVYGVTASEDDGSLSAGDAVPVPSDFIYNSGDSVTVEAGETVVYEISIGYDVTVGLIVEGEGDFDVNVCTEDGAGAYIAGENIAAVDGKVESEITGYSSTYGCGAFAITNNSDAAASYTVTLVFPEGTQNNPKPITLTVGSSVEVTVPAGGQYYVAATLPQMNTEYQLTVTGETGFGLSTSYMPTWDTDGAVVTTVQASPFTGGSSNFSILNNTQSEQTYTLTLDNMPLGTESNPDSSIVIDDNTATYEVESDSAYWYAFTAPEDGVFTLTMDNNACVDGWVYKVVHGDNVYNFSTAWGESDKNVCQVLLAKDDVVKFSVWVPTYYEAIDYYDAYTPASGTLVYSLSFASYIKSETPLTSDVTEYTVDELYPYTVFVFAPSEDGVYTITSDALLGIVSNNGMWITVDSVSAATVNNEVEWKCSSVGQSIWVAVKADSVANITITREDLPPVVEVPWTDYDNVVTPEDFTFEGNVEDLEYVDFEDDVVDDAVLGEDGFYHLNSEDGPILYVVLNDSLLSLVDANGMGQLKEVLYDENGEVSAKIDYYNAFNEYAEAAYTDEASGMMLYPLTEDLVNVLKNVGNAQLWYGEYGFIGSAEDAWMFACCYSTAAPELRGDVDGDGEITASDYLYLKRIYFGTTKYSAFEGDCKARCDVDANGAVEASDYLFLKRAYFGLYEITPEYVG